MFMRDQHPRSVQILGLATLKRDPNALTDLTAIRSINPRFEKIDNYNRPLFKILLIILKSFLDQMFLADLIGVLALTLRFLLILCVPAGMYNRNLRVGM